MNMVEDRQLLKNTIAQVIHLTPSRQAEACYTVSIFDNENKKICIQLQPSLDHLTWSRIGSKDRKDLYESMVFHAGLALGNLAAWLEDQEIKYVVNKNFPIPPEAKSSNARFILSQNIEFITYETGMWIELQRLNRIGVFDQFQYDSTKCYRDLEFVLNALCKDLEYLSNENTRSVLMEYFDREGRCLVRKSVELSAYQFVKELLNDVMSSRIPKSIHQAYKKQHLQKQAAESEAIEWLNLLLDTILKVLDRGLSNMPPLVNAVPRQKDILEVILDV